MKEKEKSNKKDKSKFFIPVDNFCDISMEILFSENIYLRRKAFNFLKICLTSMINISDYKNIVKNFKIDVGSFKSSKTALTIYSCINFFDPYSVIEQQKNDDLLAGKNQRKMEAESNLFKKIFKNFMLLVTTFGNNLQKNSKNQNLNKEEDEKKIKEEKTFKDEVFEFVEGLCVHFALFSISKCKQPPEPLRNIHPDIFLDALVEVLSNKYCHKESDQNNNKVIHNNIDNKSAGEICFECFSNVYITIFDGETISEFHNFIIGKNLLQEFVIAVIKKNGIKNVVVVKILNALLHFYHQVG
jgi:hypothetical protein